MSASINFWPLIGVAVVAVGFMCRFNPMAVVSVAAVITGVAAKFPFYEILAVIGKDFVKARNLPLITLLPLPIIGVLERHGLREFVQQVIAKVRAATPGRVLISYMLLRELSSSAGLMSLGGHAQMVRPLIAPMAEGVAKTRYETLNGAQLQRLRALAASTDNVGLFFGEIAFVAYGGILFTQNVMRNFGANVDATSLALAAVPISVFAFCLHALRLYLFDAWLQKDVQRNAAKVAPSPTHEECRP